MRSDLSNFETEVVSKATDVLIAPAFDLKWSMRTGLLWRDATHFGFARVMSDRIG
jgi:hypothetical protein